MRYFSMFSGVGGFENGILRANGTENRRSKENQKRNEEERKGLEFKKRERTCSKDGWDGEQSNCNTDSRAACFSGSQEGGTENGIRQSEAESKNSTMYQSGTPQLLGRAFCVGYSETNKYAAQIYKKHFPDHKNYGDCAKIKWEDVPDFDILVGGFPCPSFSIAGKREGLKDARGQLVFEVIRSLRCKKPKMFLLENVKGLLSHDKGRTMEIICEKLCESGYAIDFEVLNSKDFCVPQNRQRVFIVGKRIDTLPSGAIY